MRFDTSNPDLDPDHVVTAMPLLRLHTVVAWHPADDQRVKQAFAAALDALDERARSSRMILDDPHAYGLADPATLREQIHSDGTAALVIRSVLDDGPQQAPPR